MKTLVVYTSKYGSTKQYAEWIANATAATLRPAQEIRDRDIDAFDVIVCGCYLHIGKMTGADFLTTHWSALQSKRIVLFSVAGAPPNVPERVQWFEANVPDEIRSHVHHFPFRGRAMNLDLKDRFLLAFPRTMMYLKYWKTHDPKDKAAIEAFKPFDGVDKESIEPLVSHIRQLAASS